MGFMGWACERTDMFVCADEGLERSGSWVVVLKKKAASAIS
jgi:hypothetical protein